MKEKLSNNFHLKKHFFLRELLDFNYTTVDMSSVKYLVFVKNTIKEFKSEVCSQIILMNVLITKGEML